MISEAVTIEKKFICECLPSELIGINSRVNIYLNLVYEPVY